MIPEVNGGPGDAVPHGYGTQETPASPRKAPVRRRERRGSPMKVMMIHGAPAVGKLTVARSLLGMVPGRLLDNHASIDFARTVLDFGAPGFWRLAKEVRLAAVEAASRARVDLLVMTLCYTPFDMPDLDETLSSARGARPVRLLPVFLHCPAVTAERRVGNPERVTRRKLADVAGLREFSGRNSFVPIPRRNCICLETTRASPETTARRIAGHFKLHVD